MYLLKYTKEPNDFMFEDTLFNIERRMSQLKEEEFKIYECVDVTDLVLKKEDRGLYDVQTFIQYGSFGLKNPEKYGNINYARWVMNQYDVPASLDFDTQKYRKEFPLYCTYKDKRYRYVGHSRLGDVWITSDFSNSGYELRVSILDLEDFSNKP